VRTLLDAGQLDHHNVIGVEIQGHLWAQPVPLELLVRTEIDLETGKVEMADLLQARGV
jgi:type VI secretion system protein ImpF